MSEKKQKSLVSFQGGPRDGQLSQTDDVHDGTIVNDDGSIYVRQGAQSGDARIYRYTLPDGEPHPVSVTGTVDAEPTLARDIAALEAERKREGNDDGSVKKVPAG
jgi:hypothetical protein